MKASGKFVLRIPPLLHARFRQEAARRQMSLNRLLVRRLEGPADEPEILEHIVAVFGSDLIGVILFGSAVRGETRESSDVDLLLVLKNTVPIERGLYTVWDKEIAPKIDDVYSPQFAHLPEKDHYSSLWLEVAIEGEVIFDRLNEMKRLLAQIRSRIAAGEYIRKQAHGHPYWVKQDAE